jgi:hypothetical protein
MDGLKPVPFIVHKLLDRLLDSSMRRPWREQAPSCAAPGGWPIFYA